MSTAPRFPDRKALIDGRKFNFGDVWIVKDKHITMPQSDHIGKRKYHHKRAVVVISNNNENYHPLCPIVTVAPLSHQVELMKDFDLKLLKEEDNVETDCLLQLKLAQPILKKDLSEFKGTISEGKKVETQVLIEEFFGLIEEDPTA